MCYKSRCNDDMCEYSRTKAMKILSSVQEYKEQADIKIPVAFGLPNEELCFLGNILGYRIARTLGLKFPYHHHTGEEQDEIQEEPQFWITVFLHYIRKQHLSCSHVNALKS